MSLLRIAYNSSYNYFPAILRTPPFPPFTYPTPNPKPLSITRPNLTQIDHNTLNKLLISQIEDDKTLFHKQKQMVFVGRSNSGKSSLLNKVFDVKLARVAKRAGTTKNMHFFGVKDFAGVIIDTPGYGFAQMNKRRRDMWFGCLYEYLKVSSRVSQIVMCVNGEHGLKKNDLQFLSRVHQFNLSIQVVLTKIDKVKDDQLYYRMVDISKQLDGFKNISNRLIATSSKTMFGIETVRSFIVESLSLSKQRNIDQNQDLLLEYLKGNRITAQDIQAPKDRQLSKPYLVKKLVYNSKVTKYLV